MSLFNLHSPFEPQGDQPSAIAQLTESLQANNRFQTLLGATGTGKTFSIANVITNVQKPTVNCAWQSYEIAFYH